MNKKPYLCPRMKIASYILLIYWLVICLLPKTDICQLGKLPVLVTHFQKHQKESPQIDFLAFLQLHYVDQTHQNSDQDHQNLPFQHHFCDFCANCAFCLTSSIEIAAVQCFEINPTQSIYQANFYPNYQAYIWQPPKV
jgi:hypothetical protein